MKDLKSDFNALVDTTWKAHQGHLLYPTKPYLKRLLLMIYKIQEGRSSAFVITKCDIRQELLMLWVTYVKKWKERRDKSTSLKSYLLGCSIWGLRNWYAKEMKSLSHISVLSSGDPAPPFKLDLLFLADGTTFFPLSELTSYERYLIFLKYAEEKNILEIAGMVRRSRDTVTKQLNRTMYKLRSFVNAEENTR